MQYVKKMNYNKLRNSQADCPSSPISILGLQNPWHHVLVKHKVRGTPGRVALTLWKGRWGEILFKKLPTSNFHSPIVYLMINMQKTILFASSFLAFLIVAVFLALAYFYIMKGIQLPIACAQTDIRELLESKKLTNLLNSSRKPGPWKPNLLYNSGNHHKTPQ